MFAENKLHELYNLYDENRELSMEELCGEIRHFQRLGCGNIFLAQSQKFISTKLQLFCAFLISPNFPVLLFKHFCSVLFYENHLYLTHKLTFSQ